MQDLPDRKRKILQYEETLMEKKEEATGRGGKRPGAGRKPTGVPPRQVMTIRVSKEEREAIKKLLDDMRK